jgi:hypothetical protein
MFLLDVIVGTVLQFVDAGSAVAGVEWQPA